MRRTIQIALGLLGLAAHLLVWAAADVVRPIGRVAPMPGRIAAPEVITPMRLDVADDAVELDGRLDEPFWQQLPGYDDFVVIEPDTLTRGEFATRARFAYSDRGLYVGVDMQQPQETLIRRLSARDARSINRDSISLTVDTSGEGLYGYWFGIALGDSVMDGVVAPERQFSSEWDGPWEGASAITGTGWSAEYFIPWGTVAMPNAADVRRMGIYMSRKVAYLDERWGWPALPPTVPKFMSVLQQVELRQVAPRQQYNVYPFVAITADEIDNDRLYTIGADVFWRPSSNFQVNATLNPDFGGVESDDVVVNLSAVENFFQERRLFFTEGQEIFIATPRADTRGGGVGRSGSPTTMLYTRRIGGPHRNFTVPGDVTLPARERVQPVELFGAAKVNGAIGHGLRYGVLAAAEADTKYDVFVGGAPVNFHEDGREFGAVRLLWEDASSGPYRALGLLSTAVRDNQGDAFVHGVDWHWLGADGVYKIDGQAFVSDLDRDDTGFGFFNDVVYRPRPGRRHTLGTSYYDRHVDINDLGFQERRDQIRVRTSHSWTDSSLSWARENEFDVRGFSQLNNAGDHTSGGIFLSNRTLFDDLTSLTLRGGWRPKHFDDLNSFGNGIYRIEERLDASVRYETDSSQRLRLAVGAGMYEEHKGGDSYRYDGEAVWQPMDNLSLSLKVTYQDRDGWLLWQGGRDFTDFDTEQWQPELDLEYFATAHHQFRMRLQWVAIKAREHDFYVVPDRPGDLVQVDKPAGPTDDFSISQLVVQARYRWEIAPLSDLFVVYTRGSFVPGRLVDESFTDLFDDAFFRPISNELVVKLRYRFGS